MVSHFSEISFAVNEKENKKKVVSNTMTLTSKSTTIDKTKKTRATHSSTLVQT